MTQGLLFASGASAPPPLLRSVWVRKVRGTPDPWDRVIVNDLDNMGMVGLVPAFAGPVDARGARWMSTREFFKQYEGA